LVGATDSISANRDSSISKTKEAISDKKGIYYFEYLNDLHDPNGYVLSTIIDSGFSQKDVYSHFPGVGFITYFTH
jgi:hypothetical protein